MLEVKDRLPHGMGHRLEGPREPQVFPILIWVVVTWE